MELRSNAQSKTWFCVLLSLDSMSMKISKKCAQDFHKMCPKFVSFHSKAWKAKTTEWGGKLQCPSFCDKAVGTDGLRLQWEWPSECGLICGDSSGKQISLGNFSISLQFVEILFIITARALSDILLINAPCLEVMQIRYTWDRKGCSKKLQIGKGKGCHGDYSTTSSSPFKVF